MTSEFSLLNALFAPASYNLHNCLLLGYIHSRKLGLKPILLRLNVDTYLQTPKLVAFALGLSLGSPGVEDTLL